MADHLSGGPKVLMVSLSAMVIIWMLSSILMYASAWSAYHNGYHVGAGVANHNIYSILAPGLWLAGILLPVGGGIITAMAVANYWRGTRPLKVGLSLVLIILGTGISIANNSIRTLPYQAFVEGFRDAMAPRIDTNKLIAWRQGLPQLNAGDVPRSQWSADLVSLSPRAVVVDSEGTITLLWGGRGGIWGIVIDRDQSSFNEYNYYYVPLNGDARAFYVVGS